MAEGFPGACNAVGMFGTVAPQVALPPAATAAASALKSPAFSATVGTQADTETPRTSRFHSWFHQTNSLSFLIGPLTL